MTGGERDPRLRVALDPTTFRPLEYGKKRVGRPRESWVEEAVKLFWEKKVKTGRLQADLDLDNKEHRQMIRETAKMEAVKAKQPRERNRRTASYAAATWSAPGRDGAARLLIR